MSLESEFGEEEKTSRTKAQNTLIEKQKTFLANRSRAYKLIFDEKNEFFKVVMADLAKFCRANESTFHADPRLHAALEGRREVFLRIEHHLKLNIDELLNIYARKDI